MDARKYSFYTLTKKLFKEIIHLIKFQASKIVPDSLYLRNKYKKLIGEQPNFDNPKTFNEKLNWLKLHDRKEEYSRYVDKYAVREFIREKIGEEYLINCLGVWDNAYQIDFDRLPNRFVLKCTHDSASVIVCKSKDDFDRNDAIKKLNRCLKKNYYWYSREWVYKKARKRIIAEEYIEDESATELKDYKILCFDGNPRVVQVDFGRFVKHERNMYSPEWRLMDCEYNYPSNPNKDIKKPEKLDDMLRCARVLAEGIPFVRVDFYSTPKQIYFGEMTFYPEGGFGKFSPEKWNEVFGNELILPK